MKQRYNFEVNVGNALPKSIPTESPFYIAVHAENMKEAEVLAFSTMHTLYAELDTPSTTVEFLHNRQCDKGACAYCDELRALPSICTACTHYTDNTCPCWGQPSSWTIRECKHFISVEEFPDPNKVADPEDVLPEPGTLVWVRHIHSVSRVKEPWSPSQREFIAKYKDRYICQSPGSLDAVASFAEISVESPFPEYKYTMQEALGLLAKGHRIREESTKREYHPELPVITLHADCMYADITKE